MLPTEARVGWVFRYSYLWHRRYQEGHEEGDKDRPCLVLAIMSILEDGVEAVRVLPITHSPPENPADAVEIPATVKGRLGLDPQRSWIVLTESNRFVWPGPDLRPVASESGYFGPLPPNLFAEVKKRFVAIARGEANASKPRLSVRRTE